jgi:hypothetical protein
MSTVTWIELRPICSFTYTIEAPLWMNQEPKVCADHETEPADAGLNQYAQETAMIEIIRFRIAPSGERKDKLPGDVILVQPGNLAGDACP